MKSYEIKAVVLETLMCSVLGCEEQLIHGAWDWLALMYVSISVQKCMYRCSELDLYIMITNPQ